MTARFYLFGLLGTVLAAFAVSLAALEIYELSRIGTCASGGPYISARPCPEGTGGHVLLLIAAIFVLPAIAVAVFALRAKGLKGGISVGGMIVNLWTFGWLAMGTAAWVAGHGPAHSGDSAAGSTSVAITFWGIGGVSLIAVLFAVRGAATGQRSLQKAMAERDRQGTNRPQPKAPAPPPRPPRPATGQPVAPSLANLASTLSEVSRQKADDAEVSDVARRLKQLDELRALGAVTGAEYDAKRREILGEI